jgi:hypothetical protein
MSDRRLADKGIAQAPASEGGERPPHPAKVAQPRAAFGLAARPAHSAMVVQERPPHPAKVGQPAPQRAMVSQPRGAIGGPPDPAQPGTTKEGGATAQPFSGALGAAASYATTAVTSPVGLLVTGAAALYGAKKAYDYYNRYDVVFWNAQRYGSGSAVEKTNFVNNLRAEMVLLCEVVGETRQVSVGKQNRQKNRAQLGYGAYRWGQTIALDEYPVENYDLLTGNHFTDDFSTASGMGNRFVQSGKYGRSKRKPAEVGKINGVSVFVYHANADRRTAPGLIDWLVQSLRAADEPFVLVGDMNCEPHELTLSNDDVKIASSTPTHRMPHPTRVLDYALYYKCDVAAWTLHAPNNPSDHAAVGFNINSWSRWLKKKVFG